jgi:hypothetical protein
MHVSSVLRRRSLRAVGLLVVLLPGCAFSFGTAHWKSGHDEDQNGNHFLWADDDITPNSEEGAEMDRRIAELEHRIDNLEWHLHHMPPHGQGAMSGPTPRPAPPAAPMPPGAPPAPAAPGVPAAPK